MVDAVYSDELRGITIICFNPFLCVKREHICIMTRRIIVYREFMRLFYSNNNNICASVCIEVQVLLSGCSYRTVQTVVASSHQMLREDRNITVAVVVIFGAVQSERSATQ